MTVREQTEQMQAASFSKYACLAQHSKGRVKPTEPCPIRTEFARDRDRIIHCKAFRRLTHKTQVFLSPEGDHYRTRLTHTLEVSQIARTIARALGLNEELTEAIALGHDLGHTPFGHAGERALNALYEGGFQHPTQSVRVVEVLENDGEGLNLTFEVKNGIGCHSYSNPKGRALTLEGQVVFYADKIAYLNHDLEDALRAEILLPEDVPLEVRECLGDTKSQRITSMIMSVVNNSAERICMGTREEAAFQIFHSFMYDSVYKNPKAKSEESKVQLILGQLYHHYLEHLHTLPETYRHVAEASSPGRAVCDYISGMTDRYAVATYQNIFIPKSWSY